MLQQQSNDQNFSQYQSPVVNDQVIGSGKKSGLSKKAKIISGFGAFLLVFTLGFGGFGVYQNIQSNAGGADILGDPAIANESSKGLLAPEETSTFSLMNDQIYFRSYRLSSSSPTNPFPISGATYRITRSKTPIVINSWVQIKPDTVMEYTNDKTSVSRHGWYAKGTICNGSANGGTCDNPELPGERLPADVMPGDTYHYRTEIKNTDGTWSPINDEVAKYTIPKPSITIKGPESYGEADRWSESTQDDNNIAINPSLTVNWAGTGAPKHGSDTSELVADMYAYKNATVLSSNSPDMKNLDHTSFTTAGVSNESILVQQGGTVTISQSPGSTRYYALFYNLRNNASSLSEQYRQISDVVAHTTPLLKNAPKLDIIENVESLGEGIYSGPRHVYSHVRFGDIGHRGAPYSESPDRLELIVERSTKPDATYIAGDPNTKTWEESNYSRINDSFPDGRKGITYYYRVKPKNGTWTYSGKEWSQVVKVEAPTDPTTYYPAPTLSVKSVGHDTAKYSITSKASDKRGIAIQQDTNPNFNASSTSHNIPPSIDRSLTRLAVNKTNYLRLAYYASDTATKPSYTPAVSIKTLTDPYDPKLLKCSFKAPSSIKRGNKMTLSVTIKNTGTNTFLGTASPSSKQHIPAVSFFFDDASNWSTYKQFKVGAIKPGATKTITHTFTVPKKAAKNKRQAMVSSANYMSPCGDLRKKVQIK